jgi:Coenzyme PQQ synthesis protein D (PqqD)
MSDLLQGHAIVSVAGGLIVRDDLDGEVALFHPPSNQYYGLDALGAYVWKFIKQPRTLRQIMEAVLEQYEVAPERCEGDLVAFIGELAANGLIEISYGAGPEDNGPMRTAAPSAKIHV